MKNWLLVSDLDETLLGDERSLKRLLRVLQPTTERLILNSSRPIASVLATLKTSSFECLAIIGALGSEVFVPRLAVTRSLVKVPNWSRTAVDEEMLRLGFPMHAAEFQTIYKASFAIPKAARGRVILRLREIGIHADIVTSGESNFDILPQGTSKGAGTVEVCRQLHLDRRQLVVAGDSPTDVSLFETCLRGIVVGNASEDVQQSAALRGAYVARAAHAAGILEGIRHFGLHN